MSTPATGWREAVIKLTVLLRRNPALAVEEFHRQWRAHGRMIADEPVFRRYIRRYEQHHRSDDEHQITPEGYDGLVLQWFDSRSDFLALLATPEYAAKMQPDEARLLDMDSLVFFFTDEAEVFVA